MCHIPCFISMSYLYQSCLYMAELLSIRCKTLFNQSNNQSILLSTRSCVRFLVLYVSTSLSIPCPVYHHLCQIPCLECINVCVKSLVLYISTSVSVPCLVCIIMCVRSLVSSVSTSVWNPLFCVYQQVCQFHCCLCIRNVSDNITWPVCIKWY